ncbi:MAG: Ig-like domain-containing protein, partial [Petrotogales bacterium]
GYWWKKENNNQVVIDQMFSTGVVGLAGVNDDYTAWDLLFKHFNEAHGYGEVGYQPGEKIAIKVNLNNCWNTFLNTYTARDNDRDASPYVVKALLRQLVNTVGVAQEDIIVYDASRKMANWFYNRVYYKAYPAMPLDPEFPDVNFMDAEGGAYGRQKVEPSTQKIYFADESGLTRTLPKCVIEAKYIINTPLLKRHPINNGVTLSGKNFFGTWIEPVADIHPYHKASFIDGNPAPQTDLLAHEQIGGKTLLYIGDGIFGTREDHKTIAKFQMYPFNNDWTNSLFFSQDPVAIDSVMYDFLHAEGTNPNEGSQNYLHQSAEPPSELYDPENDGIFLSKSLGVHEHWDTTSYIFSSERYSGSSSNGIDFRAYGEEYAQPAIIITKPKENHLYISGKEIHSLPVSLIIGDIDIVAEINGLSADVEKVEFYIDGQYLNTDYDEPYTWSWDTPAFFRHRIDVIAHYNGRNYLNYNIVVWKFF